MKKAIIIILIVSVVGAGIAALYFLNRNKDETMKIGYSKISITPNYSVPLAGSGASSTRMSTENHDDIFATCVTLRDSDKNLAVILTIDVLHISDETNNVYSTIVNQIKKDHNIEKSNIIISATHCHSAPDIFSSLDVIQNRYLPEFFDKIKTVVADSIHDCKNSETQNFYCGNVPIENMNFVRRYFDANGKHVGANWENSNPAVAHESKIDNTLQFLKFERKGMKDVILVNWAAHAATVGGQVLSGDYIYYFRSSMESAGYEVAFFQGASGNVSTTSLIEDEIQYNRGTKEYGEKLARLFKEKLNDENNLTKLDINGKLNGTYYSCTVNYDDTDYPFVEKAIEIFEDFAEGKKTLAESNALAKQYGYSSVYECSKVRFLKLVNAETAELPLVVITFGEMSFAGAPYEMFCQNALNIRTSSKAKSTFVITHSNDSRSYIPSEDVFDNEGYEVAVCQFKKGTAEQLQNEFIRLINANY